MKRRSMRSKFWMVLIVAFLVGSLSFSTAFAESPARGPKSATAEYSEYIAEEFGVRFEATVDQDAFVKALAAVKGVGTETVEGPTLIGEFDSLAAVSVALKAAGLKELAYTYPPAKIETALKRLRVKSSSLDIKAAEELAAAVDSGLLDPSDYKGFKPTAPVSKKLAENLAGGVCVALGRYKRFIGYVSDADILSKLAQSWERASIIQAPALRAVVDAALKKQLITGYNLKDSRYDPRFIDRLSVTYGHSDPRHAAQLIALMKSEGFDAKVQFEPKTSAFVYMKDWGDPGEPNDTFEVVKIETGDWIEYAKEYDISFEFRSAEEKARFESMILAYAKKNAKNQPGLIYGAWWQPLYYSMTELPGYIVITNNKLASDGSFYAQSFTLKDDSPAIAAAFKDLSGGSDVRSYDFWVDEPFYRYLKGDSK